MDSEKGFSINELAEILIALTHSRDDLNTELDSPFFNKNETLDRIKNINSALRKIRRVFEAQGISIDNLN